MTQRQRLRSGRRQKNTTTASAAAACNAMMPSVPRPMKLVAKTVYGSARNTAIARVETMARPVTHRLATYGLRCRGWYLPSRVGSTCSRPSAKR